MKSLTKEILYNEYVVLQKTMKEIADEYNMCASCIYYSLKKYGIKGRRHLTEKSKEKISVANKGKTKKGHPCSEERKIKLSLAKKGKIRKPSLYGGYTKKRKDGYVSVFVPNHPNATKDGMVMEHHLVMEHHIGRYLKKDEVVHHINHIRDDNRIENLQLMTFKEHCRLHMLERHKKGEMTYE